MNELKKWIYDFKFSFEIIKKTFHERKLKHYKKILKIRKKFAKAKFSLSKKL